ncbi:MFS transporter [Sphaerisporangium krabiense]|uniref:MFS family permease n=1 Tax=Sphaerisporangium krabiense TaxID=763782 RepID=A0A7W8Z0N9_9ACTN|nr:MFS transporter [Sphaerisporangium krabiense]MBB5625172.1 MFS family permease [Sphaerisporangium krabiense]
MTTHQILTGPGSEKPARAPAGARHPVRVALVVAFAALVTTLNQTLVVPVLPGLPARLQVTPSVAAWLVTATIIAGAVAHPVLGRLGDQFGMRRMMIVALCAMVLGSLLCMVSDDIAVLIAGRALQGLSSATIPLGMSLVAVVLEPRRRAAAIATVSAMMGVGGALGLPAAGLVSRFWGFHGLFAVSASAGVVAMAALLLAVPAPPRRARARRVDLAGAALLTCSTVGLLVGLDRGGEWGWTNALTIACFAAALVAGCLLTLVELRRHDPLIDLRAAVSRSAAAINGGSVLIGFALFANFLGIVGRLQAPAATGYGHGLSVLATGLCLLPGGLLAATVAPLSARLSAAAGPRVTIVSGCAVSAAGFAAQIPLGHGALWGLICVVAVISAGNAMVMAALPALILRVTPETDIGVTNGLNALARAIGMSVSSAVFGIVTTVPAGAAFVARGAFDAFTVAGGVATLVALALFLLQRSGHDTGRA